MQLSEKIARAITAQAEKQCSFYLYDTSAMRAKIATLKAIMPQGVDIYYAMKANPHAAFLKAAKDENATGIEIASLGEGRTGNGRWLQAGSPDLYRPRQIAGGIALEREE